MGGDFGPRAALPAALASLQQFPQLQLTLVGDPAVIEPALAVDAAAASRCSIVAADQVVEMSDRPSQALRQKPRSSMRLALDRHAIGEVDAVVSAGNTGALMAMGVVLLKTLPGIDRPAICAAVPARGQPCYLLDVGANVDCSAEQLRQFAAMGSALVSALTGAAAPRLGLLNIGAEAGKGNEQVKEAAALLAQEPHLNYVGFVEADGIFSGAVDVVVCDGFAGNVVLKACEGTATLVAEKIRGGFNRGALAKLLGALAAPVLKTLRRELDPQRYNGACLLGLRGVVVKSHGNSTAAGFQQAIACAVAAVERELPYLITQRLAQATVG